MIFFKRILSIPLFFSIGLSVFLTAGMFAQTKDVSVPDSFVGKSSKELGTFIKKSTPEEAKIYELALSNLKNQDSAKTNEYYYIALFFYNTGNYERSAYYFNHAAKAAKQANYELFLCGIYLKEGASYIKKWRNEQALETYYKALDIAKEKEDTAYFIVASSSIAIVHKRMKQLDIALKMIKQALDRAGKTPYYKYSKNYVRLLITKSEILLDLEEYDSVLQTIDIAIDLGENLDFEEALVNLYSRKGRVFYFKKDYDLAFKYLFEAEEILNNNINNERNFITLNYYLADCFYKQNSYQKGIKYLKKTIDSLGNNYKNHVRFIDSHRLLADCYKEIGDNKKSVFWYKKYIELNAKSHGNKDKTVNKIHVRETQKLDSQINDLKSENKKGEMFTRYLLTVLLITSLILILVTLKYRRKQKSNKKMFDELIEKMTYNESKEKQNKGVKSIKKIVIDDNKVNMILRKLDRLEEEEYFLSQDCNLRSVAKKINTNATYLSKVINTQKGKNFSTYVHDLRIDYVIEILSKNTMFRKYTIKAIAHEIGFNNSETFSKAFYKKTGIYPSYFIKELEKRSKS